MEGTWTQAEKEDCWPKRMDRLGNSFCDEHIPYKPSHGITGGSFGEQLVEIRSLAGVTPPRVAYEVLMDKKLYEPDANGSAHFGDAQVEAIIFANQSFQNVFKVENVEYRRGFYLADSMGAGKTRSLAGIALEHLLNEYGSATKVLWFTGSNKKIEEIKAEWKNLDADNVPALGYNELMMCGQRNCEKAIVVMTYDQYAHPYERRMTEFWLGDNFDGLVIFDDAHCMQEKQEWVNVSEGLMPPVALQLKYRYARVVYATGTGSSDVSYLLGFHRLNLWGDNRHCRTEGDFKNFLKEMDGPTNQMLALQMKRRGVYLSRQLSFKKTIWKTYKPVSDKTFELVYDRCTQLLMLLYKYMNSDTEGTQSEDIPVHERDRNVQFWDECEQLCRQLFVSDRVNVARQYIRSVYTGDQSFVMCLEDTCAHQFKDFIKEFRWTSGLPFSSSAYMLRSILLRAGIKLGCPKTYAKGQQDPIKIGPWRAEDEAKADELYTDVLKQETGTVYGSVESASTDGNEPRACKRPRLERSVEDEPSFTTSKIWRVDSVGAYLTSIGILYDPSNVTWSYESVKEKPSASGLARLFHELYPFLPINPVDAIASMQDVMAGVTQNAKRLNIVDLTDREYAYARLPALNTWKVVTKPNVTESVELFINGEGIYATDIAIISSKSTIGLSLHADVRFKNQRPRHHLTLDFGHDPVTLLHQLGTTHRANQVVGTTYVQVKCQVPGANRFLAPVYTQLNAMKLSQKGNLQIANHFSKNLSREVFTPLALSLLKDGLVKLWSEGGLELKERMKMLNLTTHPSEPWKPADGELKDVVTCLLRTVMYLPVDQQTKLYKSFWRQYNEKRERPCQFLEIRSRNTKHFKGLSIWKIFSDGDECTVMEVTLDRCADIDTRLQCEETWKFMARNSNWRTEEPLLAVVKKEIVNGKVGAIFPFCKEEVQVPVSAFADWKELHGSFFWNYWGIQVKQMRTNPNTCIEKRWCLSNNCTRVGQLANRVGSCTHKWGAQTYYIISRPNAHLYALLKEKKICPSLTTLSGSPTGLAFYIGADTCENDFKSGISQCLLKNECLKPQFMGLKGNPHAE